MRTPARRWMVGFGSLFFVWKDRDKVIIPEKGKLRVQRECARIWSASVEAVRGTTRRPEQGRWRLIIMAYGVFLVCWGDTWIANRYSICGAVIFACLAILTSNVHLRNRHHLHSVCNANATVWKWVSHCPVPQGLSPSSHHTHTRDVCFTSIYLPRLMSLVFMPALSSSHVSPVAD